LGINKLPGYIFKMSLKQLIVENIPNLYAKIINFREKLDYCSFKNSTISCYEDDITYICNKYSFGINSSKKCNDEEKNEVIDEMFSESLEESFSDECEILKKFLNIKSYFGCCYYYSEWIKCDGYNNIKELIIEGSNIFIQSIKNFDDFPFLPKLEKLTINNIKMPKLPKIFFELPSLKYLKVTNGKTSEIPKDINIESPISHLILNDNIIKHFPYQLTNLSKLKNMDLSFNKISESLNENILKFKSLEEMYLIGNSISGILYLPKTIKIMNVVSNKFNSINYDKNINMYSPLEELIFGGNEFEGDVFDILANFKKLKILKKKKKTPL